MSRFDRYMLSQLMMLFGFFSLVLVSIYWINRAVRLFDQLIGDGQSALVFLEFSALTLPNVIRVVLPIAVFAASVYVTNRLSNESELVVMQATGFSPWRLARPIIVFGIIIAVLMSILTHLLVPISLGTMKQREIEISENFTAKLLTEGNFVHPSDGVTFFIREIDETGTLNDVYLSDRRSDEHWFTFTAENAYLIEEKGDIRLAMVNGLAQRFEPDTSRLSTTYFDDFSYNINSLLPSSQDGAPEIFHTPTVPLINHFKWMTERDLPIHGSMIEVLHARFNQAFLCIASALIGFSALLLGQFSRFGVWRQIVGAFVLLVLMKLFEGLASDIVFDDRSLWFVVYAPSLFGLSVSAIMLQMSAQPNRLRRLWARDAS